MSYKELQKEIKAVKNEFDLDRIQYKILSAYTKGVLTENKFNELLLLSFKIQKRMHKSLAKEKERYTIR